MAKQAWRLFSRSLADTNSRARLATGGGQATVEVFSPAEEVASSALFPESLHGMEWRLAVPKEVIR